MPDGEVELPKGAVVLGASEKLVVAVADFNLLRQQKNRDVF